MQLITLPGASFTRAPKLRRDSIINAGVRYLYDFGRADCWPDQAAPSLSSVFTNLVEPSGNVAGRQTATVDNATAALGWDSRGGIVFQGAVDGQHSRVNLGRAYDPGAMTDLLSVVWLRLPVCDSFASTRPILTFQDVGHPNATLSFYWEFNSGNPLVRARARIATQTTEAPDVGFAVGFGNLAQVAARLTRSAGSTTITLWINGVQRATVTTARASWPSMANLGLWLGSPNVSFARPGLMTVYRLWQENLAESGAVATDRIAADYAANAARFA